MSQISKGDRSAVNGAGFSIEKSAIAVGAAAFCTVAQLAMRWGISERQVHRYIASGQLVVTRFGRSVRISAGEVAKFEASLTGVK
jgi:excisionase family DNA binding protein